MIDEAELLYQEDRRRLNGESTAEKMKKKNRMENLCYLKIEWRINSREDEEEDGGFRSCSWKERRTKGKGFRVSL
ncbi:hypothetical protein P8452_05481 [Trifolium repens]|nr:hypothetical protein P8452_05481 [Trifolium repens]